MYIAKGFKNICSILVDIRGMRDAIPLSVITDEDLQLRQVREGWTLKNIIENAVHVIHTYVHTLMPLIVHLSCKCSHPVLSYAVSWYKNTFV